MDAASARERAEFLQLPRLHGEGLLAQAELARDRKDPEEARRQAEAALVVLEPVGFTGALPRARAHNVLGGLALATGDFERALEHVQRATQIYEAADDPRVATLYELLTSDEMAEFLADEYQGVIIPTE